jgi:hypothetical protein
MSEDKKAVAES